MSKSKLQKERVLVGVGVVLVALSCVGVSVAADEAPATASIDKSHYNLFNPTPADQMRDMETDRPDITNTPRTIDAGHFQLEAGAIDYTYYRDRYNGSNALSDSWGIGQFNLRAGVLNNLELNVEINAFQFVRSHDNISGQTMRQAGFGDTVVGAKLNFWGNDGDDETWSTAFAIQPQLKIPTARQQIGNGHTELSVDLPFIINLPAKFTLSLQTAVFWQRSFDNTGYVTGWQNAASIDRVIVGNLDVYLEYAALVTTERHQEAEQTVDFGATYPLSDNVVVDCGFNVGLNRASNTVEWVTGLTVRY